MYLKKVCIRVERNEFEVGLSQKVERNVFEVGICLGRKKRVGSRYASWKKEMYLK